MIVRLLVALLVVPGALALGLASGAAELTAVVVAAAALAAAVGERWEMDRSRQLVVSAMGGGAGFAAVAILYDQRPGHLGEGWARLAAAMLMAGVARLLLVRPAGGVAAVVVLSLLGLLTAGQARGQGPVYPALVVLFLLACLGAFRAADPGRLPIGRVGARAVAVALVISLSAAALGATLTVSARRAHARMMQRVRSSSLGWMARTGFSDQMALGSLDGLLDSTTAVLRLRGPRVDHLRGAVFDIYEAGRWMRSERLEREVEANFSGALPPGKVVEIEAISERSERFFLPLGVSAIVTTPARVKVDGFGVVKRAGTSGRPRARVVLGARESAPVEPPSPQDLTLSRRARAQISPLAEAWTAGATTPAGRLDAIEHRLRTEYRYARSFQRAATVDPVLDFLLRDRSGHCEYFATAMALLARSLDIPARVATGYRVAEWSPLGGYHVVREQNAHAWVEVWEEGKGWSVRDPTPGEFLPQNSPHEAGTLAAVLDALRVWYGEAVAWIGQRTGVQVGLVSLAGFVVLGWIIARGARGRGSKLKPAAADEEALPFLRSLLAALARAGFPHDPTEPLEHFASRLPDPRCRGLIARYVALRYGDVGDARQLAAEMLAAARDLASAPPAARRSGPS